MTGTTRFNLVILPAALLALAFVSTGCGPDAKDKKIQDLSAENEQLKNEVADRDQQLNEAAMRDNDARKTIDELNNEMAKMRAEGAKAKDGEWTTFKNFDMLSVPGEVLFASGKADLTSGGRGTLSKIATEIRSRFPDRDVYVFGHTDEQPIRKSKWRDNWELGAARALTVVRTLSGLGIPDGQLIQANCGQHRPRVKADKQDVAQNRRVEFYAVKRGTGLVETTAAHGNADE